MTEFIEREYETLKQKTQYAVWSMFKLSCDRQNILASSYKTFSRAIHQRAGADQTQKRQGPEPRTSVSLSIGSWNSGLLAIGTGLSKSPISTTRSPTCGPCVHMTMHEGPRFNVDSVC
jgi:hypothetical protein